MEPRYSVTSLREIADLFELRAREAGLKAQLCTQVVERCALRREGAVWNQAAEMLRQTTVKEIGSKPVNVSV